MIEDVYKFACRFFFAERTVIGQTYLDMLTEWLMPQLEEGISNAIFQQDGAPPHFRHHVREHLNVTRPGRWIGRTGNQDLAMLTWPPRSPDLTACDFFVWGFVKDAVYVPPLPQDLDDLKQRISDAVELITEDMLGRVWQEMEYRLDICRVTRGAHIQHL